MTPFADGPGPAAFNALPDGAAVAALSACCASRAWSGAVLAGRPYASAEQLYAAADAALAALSEADIDEALAGHPRIGEPPPNPPNPQHPERPESVESRAWSADEQAGVRDAAERTRAALAEANRAYEDRFGHVYLVCATGRSADELLAVLHRRLGNDPATEREVVRAELGKINRIRLERLLSGSDPVGRRSGETPGRERDT